MTNFNIIQIMKIVSHDAPRPYRLVETYVTSEGMRTRVCSGAFATLDHAEFRRKELEASTGGEAA